MNEELDRIGDQLFGSLEALKEMAKEKIPSLYKQWKYGGFLVDNDIVSMYPNAQFIIDQLRDSAGDDDGDDDDGDLEDEEDYEISTY